ncbi:hypothetical protein [Azospirillum canadense]|uniref:hypothetical protein n=1 Tax=Azospirillum canadense TaxID=403962 RepID=UPI00222714B7|nr:hypothetical protein [Azospirillum canadense]MCW2240351.1 hypothetical protein [Azospirillum canadense]
MPKTPPSTATATAPRPPAPAGPGATRADDGQAQGKGDGVRTDRQREAYPYGRTRLTQLVARNEHQKRILDYITGHHRNDRHSVFWLLLEAGYHAQFGTTPPPAPTDCGTRRPRPTKSGATPATPASPPRPSPTPASG